MVGDQLKLPLAGFAAELGEFLGVNVVAKNEIADRLAVFVGMRHHFNLNPARAASQVLGVALVIHPLASHQAWVQVIPNLVEFRSDDLAHGSPDD